MRILAPYYLLNISVGLLISLLSWRVSRLQRDGAYMRLWALYWIATSSSVALGIWYATVDSASASTVRSNLTIPVMLMFCVRPALMGMAAASLYPRFSRRAIGLIGAGLFTTAGIAVLAGLLSPDPAVAARSASPALFLSAAATAVFALSVFLRARTSGFLGYFNVIAISGYALHSAAMALTAAGILVYPAFASPQAAVMGSFLSFLIASGLGLAALGEAEASRDHANAFWMSARDGMIVLDSAGLVLRANPAFCRIMGRPASEIEGAPLSGSMNERDRDALDAALASVIGGSGNGSSYPVHAALSGGREVWLEFSFSTLPARGGFLSIVRDATERFATQQRYAMIVSRTPIGIHFYSLDPARGLVFTGANDAAESILGISHQSLIGKLIEEAFPSLVETDLPAAYREVLESGQPLRREEINYSDDRITGAFEVVCFRLSAGSLAVMFNNITDRKRTEEALRASESRYRLITDNSTDLISVHTPDGAFLFASPSCRSLLGYEPEDLVGRNVYDFFHRDDVASVRAAHNSLFTLASPQGVTFRVRRVDGSWIWVETFCRAIQSANDGAGANIIAVTRDVTERRNLEEQFHRSQRLDSIGRLAGGVAHDFNNLLTVINGCAGIIAGDSDSRSRTRDLASSILSAGSRAAALTQQLLAFSRKQRLEPVVLDFNQVILDAQPILQRLTRDEIRFAFCLNPDAGAILADPTQIQQVLFNLAVNARDAIDGAGTITISTKQEAVDETHPARPEVPSGHYTILSFADTGCGMTASVREKIFEPFFTTKAAGQGTGLGLSTVFGIVHQSNGHILVDSEPGRGAEFKLFFPSVIAAVPAPGP